MKHFKLLLVLLLFLIVPTISLACDTNWIVNTSCGDVVRLTQNCSTFNITHSNGTDYLTDQNMTYVNGEYFYQYTLNVPSVDLYTINFCDGNVWTQLNAQTFTDYIQTQVSTGGNNVVYVIGVILLGIVALFAYFAVNMKGTKVAEILRICFFNMAFVFLLLVINFAKISAEDGALSDKVISMLTTAYTSMVAITIGVISVTVVYFIVMIINALMNKKTKEYEERQ